MNLSFFVELRDARPAVPVSDEVGPVGQPGDVRRAIEGVRAPSPDAELAVREHELAVIGELVDDVKLVVENPHVLLFIVRADFDLVRTAAAGQLLEQLVLIRPLVDEVALPVEDDDRMLEPPLPSAFVGRLAGRAEAVGVARRIAAGGSKRRVRRPGLGVLRAAAAHRAWRPRSDRGFRHTPPRTIPRSTRRGNDECPAAVWASPRRRGRGRSASPGSSTDLAAAGALAGVGVGAGVSAAVQPASADIDITDATSTCDPTVCTAHEKPPQRVGFASRPTRGVGGLITGYTISLSASDFQRKVPESKKGSGVFFFES